MKKALIIGFSLLTLPIMAQKNNVPEGILTQFTQQYNLPSGTESIWKQNENSFTVSFTNQGFKNEITYNMEGVQIESLLEMSKGRLNETQISYINEHYKKAKIQATYLLQSAVAPERYVVDLVLDGQRTRLFFRPDGEFHMEQKL
jgi:hypothetical protein